MYRKILLFTIQVIVINSCLSQVYRQDDIVYFQEDGNNEKKEIIKQKNRLLKKIGSLKMHQLEDYNSEVTRLTIGISNYIKLIYFFHRRNNPLLNIKEIY